MTHGEFRRRIARPAGELLVAPLALDALSAALAKRIGFSAVYLGGGGLGFARATSEALLTTTEVAEATRAITERVDIAVVVDGTNGFGDAIHTARAVRMIEQAGAAAIEIEDQLAPKRAHHHKGHDHIVSLEEMVGKIEAAVEARVDPEFTIIARCNAIGHAGLDDALERCDAYEAAGADMLLLYPREPAHFEALASKTSLPLVVMLPTQRSVADLLAGGFTLGVDPFSATVRAYAAIKEGYDALAAGDLHQDWDAALAQLEAIGETINLERLYRIEARTTERDYYDEGGA
jgi:2-methylisocitrate lyase-like PEP mutase family enzyme